MPKGYTTKEQVENYTLTEIDTTFDTQIDEWITAVEKYIDLITERSFITDSDEPTERVFDGNGKEEMAIDECISIESITINDEFATAIYEPTATDYTTYPLNELPIRKIKLKTTYEGYFISGDGNITIEACWGYSEEVPETIRFVATVLMAGIINVSNDAGGEIKSEKIGDYSVTYKDEQQPDYQRALDILGSYKKYDV